jgi:hypothetical protein|nr:MAG TPA_asm: hypothetical protein [Caudoviricetes sp.]
MEDNKLWVAREKRGGLFLYKTKPERDCDYGIWFSNLDCMGAISKNLFPDLKWENEPIEVEFRPAISDLDAKASEYANNVTKTASDTISSKADGYKTEIFEILGAYLKELDTNKVQFSQQGVSQDKIKINQLCETLKLIYEYFKKNTN